MKAVTMAVADSKEVTPRGTSSKVRERNELEIFLFVYLLYFNLLSVFILSVFIVMLFLWFGSFYEINFTYKLISLFLNLLYRLLRRNKPGRKKMITFRSNQTRSDSDQIRSDQRNVILSHYNIPEEYSSPTTTVNGCFI